MSPDAVPPSPFPSLQWMEAYARTVGAHPRAAEMASSLAGRYRFAITPAGPVNRLHRYDLVVGHGEDGLPSFTAEDATGQDAALTVTADYERWRGLLTGKSDFVMSFLMRKIKVDGDVGAIKSRVSDAKPLLDCLSDVPTTWAA
jgi:hypothetical protein